MAHPNRDCLSAPITRADIRKWFDVKKLIEEAIKDPHGKTVKLPVSVSWGWHKENTEAWDLTYDWDTHRLDVKPTQPR